MNHAIHISRQKSGPTLEITSTVPLTKVHQTLIDQWAKISSQIERSNVKQIDQPYAQFLDIDWEKLTSPSPFSQLKQMIFAKQKLIAGIRLKTPAQGTTEILSTQFSPGRCIMAKHFGPPHKVTETYKTILNWAHQHRLKINNNPIEIYTHAPSGASTDQTEITILVPILD